MSGLFDVARVGDLCISPTGKRGSITTGSDSYWVNGCKSARLGDMVTYADGTTTAIAEGSSSVFADGRPVALQGGRLADGGRILTGSPNVHAGTPTPGRGTGAERTLVSARSRAQGLVPVDCPARVARVFAAADSAPAGAPTPEAPTPVVTRQAAVDRDLPHGGRWDDSTPAGTPA